MRAPPDLSVLETGGNAVSSFKLTFNHALLANRTSKISGTISFAQWWVVLDLTSETL